MSAEIGWWIAAEDGGVEREFVWPYINREFGIRLYYGGNQAERQLERISRGRPALIFVDNSVTNISFLRDFPKGGVIAFLVSNETYSLELAFKLFRHPSIRAVVTDYPRRKVSINLCWLALIIRFCTRLKLINISLKDYFRSIFSGLIMAVRQMVLSLFSKCSGKQWTDIPLGYTNAFAAIYSNRYELKNADSILFHASKRKYLNSGNSHLYFSGQEGSPQRRMIIHEAKSMKVDLGPIYKTFGGPSNSEELPQAQENYFNGLGSSQFGICPPGNYSAESFRYIEALIQHCFPLRPRCVISDPFFLNTDLLSWDDFSVSTISDLSSVETEKLIFAALDSLILEITIKQKDFC